MRATATPPHGGEHWSEQEEALLAERFEQGSNLQALCVHHGRSPDAILTRLRRLKLIVMSEDGRGYYRADRCFASFDDVKDARNQVEY